MKIERFILRDELEENTLYEKLVKRLPKNTIMLSEKNKLVRQFTSYGSIELELRYLNDIIDKLAAIRIQDIEEQNFDKNDSHLVVKKSLFIAAVTSYGRCFNSTKKGGRISMDEQFIINGFPNLPNIPDFPDLSLKEILKFHKRLMNLRNKFVSHADKSIFDQTIPFIEFSFKKNLLKSKFNYISLNLYSFDQAEMTYFIILVGFLQKKVKEKMKLLSDKIVDEITEEGLLYLYKGTLKNNKKPK